MRDASILTDLFVALDSYPSSSAAATTTHITASISKCIEDASANQSILNMLQNLLHMSSATNKSVNIDASRNIGKE